LGNTRIKTEDLTPLTNAEVESSYNNQVSIVSQAEAELGLNTTVRRWTAERVKQAIDAAGGTVKQIFSTKLIFTSTAATRTSTIFGEVVKATDADAKTLLNSAITAVDNTIFLDTNSKTSTITFALNDDGTDVLQISTTSGQTGEFSATGSVVVAAGSFVNFTEDGGTSVGQLNYSMILEYTR